MNSFGSELNQVWTNLIDNAIDAMSGKGELRVRTYRDGDCVVVEIGDNGPGIPPDVKPHIFEPFFHHQGSRGGNWTRPRYGSANCEEAPGHVFRSIPNQGTHVFKCRCPLAEVASNSAPTKKIQIAWAA